MALASLDALGRSRGWNVSRDAVVRGFATLRWPARVEVLGESPWLIVDCAHNVASAERWRPACRQVSPTTPRTLVFATSRDKDLRGQLQVLLPLFDQIIVTRYLENPRAVAPEEIARTVEELDGRAAIVAVDPAQRWLLLGNGPGPRALICVTGSLFLAAESRALLLNEEAVPAVGRILA